jgi:hypothetical protein
MDCRSFRQHHVAYVDDTLPGDLLVAAERHVAECTACRAHDTLVRRSLLLARNCQEVECSPDFMARLEARLHDGGDRCGRAIGAGRPTGLTRSRLPLGREDDLGDAAFLVSDRASRWRPTRRSAARTATLAASMLALATAAGVTLDERSVTPAVPTLPPVVASQPAVPAQGPATMAELEPAAPLPATAVMVPAAMGVSMWPAALLAGEMPAELLRASVRGRGGRAGSGVMQAGLTGGGFEVVRLAR